MSRNPIAAYTHRTGFGLGQVEFKDFLWEALHDPAACVNMGDTAENLAKQYGITRARSTASPCRALREQLQRAMRACWPKRSRRSRAKASRPKDLSRGVSRCPRVRIESSTKTRTSGRRRSKCWRGSSRRSAACRPAAILGDRRRRCGGAGCLDRICDERRVRPLGRIVAWPPSVYRRQIMGIGPAPAIRAVLEATGLKLAADRPHRDQRSLRGADPRMPEGTRLGDERVNVNGGAIAIGHPLGATGVRLALTLARELRRSGCRYGIAAACIGGGQGIAMLVERS